MNRKYRRVASWYAWNTFHTPLALNLSNFSFRLEVIHFGSNKEIPTWTASHLLIGIFPKHKSKKCKSCCISLVLFFWMLLHWKRCVKLLEDKFSNGCKRRCIYGDSLKGHYLKKKFSSHPDLRVARPIQG